MKIYNYILKIIFALIITGGICYVCYPYLLNNVLQTKEATLLIIIFFIFGLFYDLIRFLIISSKINWIYNHKNQHDMTISSIGKTPKSFLMIEDKLNIIKKNKITFEEYNNIINELNTNSINNKDAGQFLVKTCFIAGLLGAFVYIIMSITSIIDIFNVIELNSNKTVDVINSIQNQLAEPLKNLNKALTLSVLGIYFSYVLSYVDRQVFIAENKLVSYTKDWLLSCTNQTNK
jgi:hypothetical protein